MPTRIARLIVWLLSPFPSYCARLSRGLMEAMFGVGPALTWGDLSPFRKSGGASARTRLCSGQTSASGRRLP